MDQVFEGTPQAEIRLEGRKLVRTDVTGDWGSRLQWEIKHDGKVVATPPARADHAYDYSDNKPGKYEVVLQIWKYEGFKSGTQGKYIVISNKVEYTV